MKFKKFQGVTVGGASKGGGAKGTAA